MAHWEDVLAIREDADELVRTDEGWKIASRRVDDFLWRRESTPS